MTRCALAIVCLALAAPPAQAKRTTFGHCHVGESRILAAGAGAVVFKRHGVVRGCDVRTGRARKLVHVGCAPDDCVVSVAAVAGRVVVVATDFSGRSGIQDAILGYDFGRRRWILARDNGEMPFEDEHWCGYGDSSGVGRTMSLVVSASGAAAWIARRDCRPPGEPATYEVRMTDGAASPVVAQGSDIDPRSLALAGNRFFWMQAGAAAGAALGSPPADAYEPTELGLGTG